MKPETPRWVLLAHILRPRGNKGEVAAVLLTDFPERLAKMKEVFVGRADGGSGASNRPANSKAPAAKQSVSTEPYTIGLKSFWISQNHAGQCVFHFEGVNSINDAEKFRGLDVLLPFEQRVKLPAGQYFVSDLVGCSVFEQPAAPRSVASSPCSLAEAPAFLGVVRDVQFQAPRIAGTPLLEVETSSGELLIPLAEDICTRIDTPARRIEVVLPAGLRELNDAAAPRV